MRFRALFNRIQYEKRSLRKSSSGDCFQWTSMESRTEPSPAYNLP